MKKGLSFLLAVLLLSFAFLPLQPALAANTLTGLDLMVPDGYSLTPSFSPNIDRYTLTTSAEWVIIIPYYRGSDKAVMICNPNDENVSGYLSSGEASMPIQIKGLTYYNNSGAYTADMDFLMVEIWRGDKEPRTYDVYLFELKHEYVEGSDSYNSSSSTTSTLPDLVPDQITIDGEYSRIVRGITGESYPVYTPGKQLYFDSGITNTGSVEAKGVFNIKWYRDGTEVGYGGHKTVPAGTDMTWDNSQYYWTPMEPGTYTIIFWVDCDNHVKESNENNNKTEITVHVGY